MICKVLHNMNAATTRPDLTPHHVATPCDQGHRYVGVMPHEAQHASMRMAQATSTCSAQRSLSRFYTDLSRPLSAHRGNSRAELVPLTVQLSHHHNGSKPLPVHASCFRKRQAAYE